MPAITSKFAGTRGCAYDSTQGIKAKVGLVCSTGLGLTCVAAAAGEVEGLVAYFNTKWQPSRGCEFMSMYSQFAGVSGFGV